jgi:hypothetical protein
MWGFLFDHISARIKIDNSTSKSILREGFMKEIGSGKGDGRKRVSSKKPKKCLRIICDDQFAHELIEQINPSSDNPRFVTQSPQWYNLSIPIDSGEFYSKVIERGHLCCSASDIFVVLSRPRDFQEGLYYLGMQSLKCSDEEYRILGFYFDMSYVLHINTVLANNLGLEEIFIFRFRQSKTLPVFKN